MKKTEIMPDFIQRSKPVANPAVILVARDVQTVSCAAVFRLLGAGVLLGAGLCATSALRGDGTLQSSETLRPPENAPDARAPASGYAGGAPLRMNASVDEVRMLAEAGSAPAQAQMGYIYATGDHGVKVDNAEASRWFRKAAGGGDAWGQVAVGAEYLSGINGAEQNLDEAVKWFRKSAEQGNALAQTWMGDLCMAGEGEGSLEDSHKEAALWYEKAALQGKAEAQEKLGGLYMSGQGVPANPVEGVKWIHKAADGGDGLAMLALCDIYTRGVGGVAVDYKMVRKYGEAAMKQNDMRVQLLMAEYDAQGIIGNRKNAKMATMGFLLATQNNGPVADLRYRRLRYDFMLRVYGSGTTSDEIEAVRLLREASADGDPWAQLILGELHMRGAGGLAKDESKAETIFRQLAEKGMPEAQVALGYMHVLGQGGLESSQAKAVEWFLKAAEANFAPAQTALGKRYQLIYGNHAEAVKWFMKAAHNRDADAQIALGDEYMRGRGGLPKNEAEARKWFKRAAASGKFTAASRLEQLK